MRANVATTSLAATCDRRNSGWAAELLTIVLLVIGLSIVYGARLGRQPIVGEESRYATGAREMLATGDWIVPRQQGHVFPERPPMSFWVIAIVGWMRGGVDPIAVRLPSVVAVVLTSLLIYGYVRSFGSRQAALASAVIYATMGQVLQIGRLGESEALFTLFLSAALLGWHMSYLRGWRPVVTWMLGFGFCAAAAMVKGPQAPVYFVTITAAYLALRGEWRSLFRWEYLAGAFAFIAIIAAWQIPFYLATDWTTVMATWSGLSADRIRLSGAASHMVTYPLETFACLLPWSPLLVALAKRETRMLLVGQRNVTTFLTTALLVAYPTVWLAAGARGRYFMPLYPLVAVVIGLVIEQCARASRGAYPRRAWHQFLLLASVLICGGGVVIAVGGVMAGSSMSWPFQPLWFGVVFAIFAAGTTYVLWRSYCAANRMAPIAAVLATGTFVSLGYAGVIININAVRWNDPTPVVAKLKSQIPSNVQLVSLCPIEHRFEYYYGTPIAEIDWPTNVDDLPADADYFCFMRNPGDSRQQRVAGRGRIWTTTPGTLPFAWEEIASIGIERRVREGSQRMVVLGRVVRPVEAFVSDATVPQQQIAGRPRNKRTR